MRIFKSNEMQNLVVFMDPSENVDSYNVSLKGGNMILNRFCIDRLNSGISNRHNFFLGAIFYFQKLGINQ